MVAQGWQGEGTRHVGTSSSTGGRVTRFIHQRRTHSGIFAGAAFFAVPEIPCYTTPSLQLTSLRMKLSYTELMVLSSVLRSSAGVHVGLSADAVYYLLRAILMCSVLSQAGAAGYIAYEFETRSKGLK